MVHKPTTVPGPRVAEPGTSIRLPQFKQELWFSFPDALGGPRFRGDDGSANDGSANYNGAIAWLIMMVPLSGFMILRVKTSP